MTATTFNFWTGDVVRDTISGELYEVKKINPKNVRCQAMDGRLWNINLGRLTAATEAETTSFRESMLDILLDGTNYRLGTVCKFKVADKPLKQGYFVVTKVKEDSVSLAFLGGNLQSRYWPAIPTVLLERVDGVITVHNV